MKNDKSQKNTVFLFLAVVVIIVIGAIYWAIINPGICPASRLQQAQLQQQQQAIPNQQLNQGKEVDISDWLTYRNEQYGFEVKYPEKYKKDEVYNIWTASNETTSLLWEWGVNKGQETIISISVYPRNKKQEIIDSGKLQILDRQVKLANYKAEEVKFLSFKSFMVEGESNIYILISSYSEDYYSNLNEYKEYYNIISSLNLY